MVERICRKGKFFVQPNDKDDAIISCCSTIILLQAYFTQNIVADGQTFRHTKRINTVRTRSKLKFICKLINKEACISQAATVSILCHTICKLSILAVLLIGHCTPPAR